MQTLARIIVALALLVITAFCLFGFLATYEYADAYKRLPWQIGYGLLGLACLSGVGWLLRRHRRKPSHTDISS